MSHILLLDIFYLFRNEVSRKRIYHGLELQLYEETNVNDHYEYDWEMFRDVEYNIFTFRNHIKNRLTT